MALQSQNRAGAAPTGRARRGGWRPDRQPEGYLFLLPSLAGFLLFTALPVLAALGLSFVRWNLLTPPQFVGIQNYVELLTRDAVFRTVFGNTLFFTVTVVPIQLGLGLLLATLLNRQMRGITLYRVIYFMPVVTTVVAAALVFQWLFNRDFGIISAAIYGLADLTGLRLQPPAVVGRQLDRPVDVGVPRHDHHQVQLRAAPQRRSEQPGDVR